MPHRIEVRLKPSFPDSRRSGILSELRQWTIESVRDVHVVQVTFIDGDVSQNDLTRIASTLLSDAVSEEYRIDSHFYDERANRVVLEIARKPGVTDPVETSVAKGIEDLGLRVRAVRTARQVCLDGNPSPTQLDLIANRILANPVVDQCITGFMKPSFGAPANYRFKRIEVDLLNKTQQELDALSKERRLSLNSAEMKAVQSHFTALKRNPTDVELETIAQTWSEHCKHKTLTGKIEYNGELIDNLFKATIRKATEELKRDWCISVFVDNAGIISLDKDWAVCMKVETHNHPSAIEPYGGAGTGIGGVIRDILGTGLGAKPVLNTDVFCFGRPDYPEQELPKGTLHPLKILKGVVSGVRDYGNRMGIPTANGAVCFDDRYVGNPLVYCGTVGLLPKHKVAKQAKAGDLILVIGGRTGRDGIGGATFSSIELDETSEVVSATSVQIGNPIVEKRALDALLRARDEGLYHAVTDCGAGGFSSAVGEMGEECGAVVYLERAPLKYQGLSYAEIWLSEAQERMVFAVPQNKLPRFLDICREEGVEAFVLGEFTNTGKLELRYESHEVGALDMKFLHGGLPRIVRKAEWKQPDLQEPALLAPADYRATVLNLLAMPNIASKEWIIRQYDHEVQGQLAVKPLQGEYRDGPGDGCAFTPLYGNRTAVVVSNGINPCYGDIDPYHMAMSAIDEALRNNVATGGDPDRTAILDNFSWGNTDKPDRLGALVRACRGCYDAAKGFGTPFISGKDSLNNEYKTERGTIVIPHTLLISALSVIDDVTRTMTMDFKQPGNIVYLVGTTRDELGGSHFYRLHGAVGASVPEVNVQSALQAFRKIHTAIKTGTVRACHDLSEGGLAVALAESALAGDLGVAVTLEKAPCSGDLPDWKVLFSESNSRFIVEVEPARQKEFEQIMNGCACAAIGVVLAEKTLRITGKSGVELCKCPVSDLKKAWRKTLQFDRGDAS